MNKVIKKATQGSRRFGLIRLCIFLSGLSVFAQLYLFQPLLPEVAHFFGTSLGSSSFLVSASTIGMALGLFFFTFKADNFSRKKVMVFALMSSAVLTIVSAYIQSLLVLVFIGVLKGFMVSGVSAVALAYIMEEIEEVHTGAAVGFYLSGNIIGGMSGRILATLVASQWQWQMAVLVIGIESLILGIAFWKLFPESRFFTPIKQSYHIKIDRMKSFLKDLYLMCLFVIAALLMGVFVSVYNYISFRLDNPPFNLSSFYIASIFVMYLFGVLGTMLTHKLTMHFKPVYILAGAALLMGVGVLTLLSNLIFGIVLGLGLLTMTFFMVHTMASQMVAKHAAEGRSSATSLYWLFYYIGSSALGSATGYLLNATNWLDFIAILVIAIGVAFVLILKVGQLTGVKSVGRVWRHSMK